MTARHNTLLAAEAALLGLSIVVAIALERLFIDTSFLRQTLIMVVGSHVVAAATRRAGLSMAVATPISGLALIVLGTAVFYPDASLLIIPTGETVTALGNDLRAAWEVFGEDAAPVPAIKGFVVTAAALIWYGAFLADWAAFRLRSPLEAVAPAAAVFVFASLLGVDRNEIAHGLTFAIGLLAVLVTMRAERQVREEVWVADGSNRGVRTTLQLGAAIGVAAVLVGAFLAPSLPGASAQPIIDINELNDGPQTRSVVSPLVEVSASLVQQADTELFAVEVAEEERDYWRLMALTKFEDEIWARSSNFDQVRDTVGSDVADGVLTRPVTQRITNLALGNIYLPAAYEVSEVIDNGGVELEYEVATGALVVERSLKDVPLGYTYEIESATPDFAPEDLPQVATTGLSGDFVREHTQLPAPCADDELAGETGCWPTGVTALAQEIVTNAGATTDHARVLALQNFFLDPTQFSYNIDVALEHNIDDMNTFLTVREGYCEQFASTFAAMARSIGIPARVAVGFTWGEYDQSRGAYIVSGKHAHAWPEVYFAGVGWVIFDPTPGRSRGYDSDITGLSVPEQFGANNDPDNPAQTPTSTTTTLAPAATPGEGSRPVTPTTQAPAGEGTPTEDDSVIPVADDDSGSGPWGTLAVLVLALGAAIGFVPAVQALRRRRRASLIAADPAGQAELAWDDAIGALRLLGFEPRGDQTPHEFATMVEGRRRAVGPVRELADDVTHLRYSTEVDAVSHATAAQAAAAEIVTTVRAEVGRPRVWRDAIDPRTLLRPAPAPLHLGS